MSHNTVASIAARAANWRRLFLASEINRWLGTMPSHLSAARNWHCYLTISLHLEWAEAVD